MADAMTGEPGRQLPVDCEFHDLSEELAVNRKPVLSDFVDATGGVRRRNASLGDASATDGADHLSMRTQETVRRYRAGGGRQLG